MTIVNKVKCSFSRHFFLKVEIREKLLQIVEHFHFSTSRDGMKTGILTIDQRNLRPLQISDANL